MKRLIYTILVLIAGGGIGAGGLYIGTHWDQFNPFKKPDAREPLLRLTALLRKSSATDEAWKGILIKSVDVTNGKLTFRGVVASKDQIPLLEARGRTFLEEAPELQVQCGSGVSTEGLFVLPIFEQLGALQRDFNEGRGAEQDDAKRQVMHTTRLDGVAVTEDGKLTFSGVCVHGNVTTDVSSNILRDALSNRLDALGATSAFLPDIGLDVRYFPSPAITVQKQFDKNKDIHLTAAWYDAKGKLHVAGIVGQDTDRQLVDGAVSAYAKDPQTAPVAQAKGAASSYVLELATFQPATRLPDLQKKLVEYARKENKPHLRRVRLEQVLPTPIEDEKKQARVDGEGNIMYYFRVKGRLYETAGERAQIESELKAWLIAELPRVPNPDRKPIEPGLVFTVKDSPIFALQERVVQRGFDGAVFTDALFDETGKLELLGRAHESDDDGKQALAASVKDLLAKEPAWTMQTLTAHESNSKGQTIAWTDVMSQCQAKLAQDAPLGHRLRVDRLYFRYENQQLRLLADGVFLMDVLKENPDGALRKAVDAVISSRGQAYVKGSGIKQVRNPVAEVQSLSTARADLDGVLFTSIHYGADGVLHFDGFLGDAAHAKAVTPILVKRLEQTPRLLKKGSDPQAMAGWSIEGMKPYPSATGDLKWSEVVRTCQAELAGAEAIFRRACMGRVYFQYAEVKPFEADARPRRLLLQCKTTYLTRPAEGGDDAGLKQKIELKLRGVSIRLLAGVAIDQIQAELTLLDSPIFELQKQAVAKSYDGILFKDATYDRDGKLVFDGLRGNAGQLKQAKDLIDQLLADKEKKAIAPVGLGPLDGLRLVDWQPMLDDLRTHFAQEKATLFKQTRIDRAYFQYDKSRTKPLLHFKGIRIYEGKILNEEQQLGSLADKLKKRLPVKGVDDFDLDLGDMSRVANPVYEMQQKVKDNKWDGVVFAEIGFDAKGACYVSVPFAPDGLADNIRKLIEETSKKHAHLGTIVQH